MDAAASPIRTRRQRECHVCSGAGDVAYSGLRDRLFGVSGEWMLRRCQDRRCGLLWLDPMPVEEDLPRLYETYHTHADPPKSGQKARIREEIKAAYWSANYGYAGSRSARSAVLAALVKLSPGDRAQADLQVFELRAKRGGRLLDVGCGGGVAMKRMANLGWQVEGIDFDEKAVDFARSNGLDARLGDLEQQAYPADTFDAIVMSHVLEHVADPCALFRECRRILKRGGRLVSVTPNAGGWGHDTFKHDWRGLEPPRHLHIFTMNSLRNLAINAGWSKVTVSSSIANYTGIISASEILSNNDCVNLNSTPPLSKKVRLRLIQLVAAARIVFVPEIGEELVLHAVKGG